MKEKTLKIALVTIFALLALFFAGFYDGNSAHAARTIPPCCDGGGTYAPCDGQWNGSYQYMVANRLSVPGGQHWYYCSYHIGVRLLWDSLHVAYFVDPAVTQFCTICNSPDQVGSSQYDTWGDHYAWTYSSW